MPVPFTDLPAQYKAIKPEIDAAIARVLETAAYSLGPAVEAFEKDFAAYCETRHCIGLNSGTAALALLLQAADIGPGDEVITAANSFFASAEAISEVGATPVLVDCDPSMANMDVSLLEHAITPNTKAVIPVHLYGLPADMDAILAITRPRNLLVFEDACQAHGATYRGKKAGSLADGAAFSFYPAKNLGAFGEAGAVTTDNDELNKRIRMLREHGSSARYHHDLVGWNERMDGIQGAVLGVKLAHLDAWNARRRALVELYRRRMPASARMFAEPAHARSSWHLLVIRVPNRDRVREQLTERGIQTAIHYPVPIHLQKAYEGRWNPGDFPVAEALAGEILSLPLYAEMTDAQAEEVCGAVNDILS